MSDSNYEMLLQLAANEVVEIWLAWQTAPHGGARLVTVKQVDLSRVDYNVFSKKVVDAARVHHPNVLTTLDLGEEGNACFVVHELLTGEPLMEVINRSRSLGQQSLDPAVSAFIASQAAAALHAAHVVVDDHHQPAGLAHGNLHPGSILVGYDGQIKVTDFDGTSGHMQQTSMGANVADPRYMSPEQCISGQIDYRSDVYTLGILFWELLTGQDIYIGKDEFDLMEAITEERVPPPSQFNRQVPPFLDAVCNKALAKDPNQRFPDARRFAGTLDKVVQKLQPGFTSSHVAGLMAKLFPSRLRDWQAARHAESRSDSPEVVRLFSELYGMAATTSMAVTRPPGAGYPQSSSPVAAAAQNPSVFDRDATNVFQAGQHAPATNQGDSGKKGGDGWSEVAAHDVMNQLDSLFSPRDDEPTLGAGDQWDQPTRRAETPSTLPPELNVSVASAPPQSSPPPPSPSRPVSAPSGSSISSRSAPRGRKRLGRRSRAAAVEDRPRQRVEEPKLGSPLLDDEEKTKVHLAPPPENRPEPVRSAMPDPTPARQPDPAPTPRQPEPVPEPEPEPVADFADPWADDTSISDEPTPVPTKPKPASVEIPPELEENVRRADDTRRMPVDTNKPAKKPEQADAMFEAPAGDLDDFFDEDDDELTFVEPFSMTEVIGSGKPIPNEPGVQLSAAPVMEVIRTSKHEKVTGMTELGFGNKKSYKPRDSNVSFALQGARAVVNYPEGVTGYIHRVRSGREEIPKGPGAVQFDVGDTAIIKEDRLTYRCRVYNPPVPLKRSLTPAVIAGAAMTWALTYGTSFVIAFLIHMGFFVGMWWLDASGALQMRATDKPQEEIFAEGTLKKEKPKEKPKPKPKKKKKPKPKKKVEKPPDPTEQKVKISKTVRKKLAAKLKQNNKGGKKSDNLVSQLTTKKLGEGKTLTDVVTNIDAANTGRTNAAFKLTGELAAVEGGAKVNLATSGGSKNIGKLAGNVADAKNKGKLSERKDKGPVRGKVRGLSAAAKVQGSLSRGEVLKVINRYLGRIQGCYERQLINNPTLSGKVTFGWTITPAGRVSGVKQVNSTLNNAAVSSCISKIIRGMKFPQPKGGPVSIRFPFIFRSAS